MRILYGCILLTLFAVLPNLTDAKQRNRAAVSTPSNPMDGKFDNFPIRNIAPAKTSGRVTDIAIDPRSRSIRYVATASGNVWKTVNAGTTWTPIFDRYGSYSIGVVTIDPNNPNTIWLGTGENNSQRSVGYGDGVYKSLDGGKSWQNMGLKSSEHIGKIVVDPRNSDIVYVAAQGPLWNPGGERGLYKTIDGGNSWERILHVSEDTGISEFVMDPENPDLLYAASYQRRRHFGILVAGGPEGAAYKSVDAGKSWTKLSNGFPGGDLGRIALAVSPQKPNVVYALVVGMERTKGFYRSEDYGNSWTKMSDYVVVDPQYYMELFPDPNVFDKVYSVDMRSQYTEDGGKTFKSINENRKHVDSHEIVFDPADPNYIMFGCDGGIYESWDNMETWKFTDNMPITQFYRVGLDNDEPFYSIYGGTQDNASLGGPSRTTNRMGIRNSDWFVTTGGDGFQVRVDPTDPNIVYTMSQYAGVVRFDKKSGQKFDIKPLPGENEPGLKWNWDAPLIISPHNPSRIYFAANKLFRSEDKAISWKPVSEDLTRQEDRNKKEVMGKVWPIDAIFKNVFTSPLGTIVSLDESPLQEGLLYVGTDDGLIQISENGGETWRKVEGIPGLPSRAYVGDIFASRTDVNTVFAVFNYHKYGDLTPYVYKSSDKGRSWSSIAGNIPKREIAWSIVQDHVNSNLLFLGTEFGLYYSLNMGATWNKFKQVPTIPIRDLEIQQRENDLVGASFGRGFFIIDDYTPLRNARPEVFAKDAHLFPVKDALQFVMSNPDGGALGHSFFTSENPPYGAVFTFALKNAVKTKAQIRKEKETSLLKSNQPVPYPSWASLLEEEREGRPVLVFSIVDQSGRLMRRLTRPVSTGVNQIVWDLRSSTAGSGRRGGGVMVPPGKYKVSMGILSDDKWEDLGESQEFDVRALDNVTSPSKDRLALFEFQMEVAEKIAEANSLIKSIEDHIKELQEKSDEIRLDGDLGELPEIRKQIALFEDLILELTGNRMIGQHAEIAPPSILDRLNQVRWGSSEVTSDPTTTHRESYLIAVKGLRKVTEKYNELGSNQ